MNEERKCERDVVLVFDPDLNRALARLRERLEAIEVEINGPRPLPSARVGRSSRAGAFVRMWMLLRGCCRRLG